MLKKTTFLLFIITLFFSCKKNDKLLSPVDLTNNAIKDTSLTALFDDYQKNDYKITNKGSFLLIKTEDNFLVIPEKNNYLGEQVDLKGILIKTPSEHTVNGKHYPLELQFYHSDSAENAVIISVFVKQGKENLEFNKIIENLPEKNQNAIVKDLDLYNIFQHSPEYWYYKGTTTNTPIKPARWFIMKKPIEASATQIKDIQDVLEPNTTEIVDLGNRKLYKN